MSEVIDVLSSGLDEMGLAQRIPPSAVQTLDRYGQLLLEKNQVMNLTAIRDPEGVARLHFLDCAALLNLPGVDFGGKNLIDVGTGAGFPGMVLKILVPSLETALLDSLNKRLDWLEETAGALDLPGIRTIHARAEELAHDTDYRERFDFATARAVAGLEALCELCLPYVKVGGRFLAMKGPECAAELDRAADTIRRLGGEVETVWEYTIPGADVSRRVAVIRKAAPTPPAFPRKWGKIKKEARS